MPERKRSPELLALEEKFARMRKENPVYVTEPTASHPNGMTLEEFVEGHPTEVRVDHEVSPNFRPSCGSVVKGTPPVKKSST